ncbi:hypothetical protein BH11MYX4_BH11MYX4_13380 [soil metagenome]
MTANDDLFVMHPDASAMMGDGRVLVALHNAEGAVTSVESEKPELAAVVMGFSRPMALSSLGERFPYFPHDTLTSAVDLLRVAGLLIGASELLRDESVEQEMMVESARALAKSAKKIEEELTALGPSSNAVRLRRRLRSVEAQASLVATELGVRRSMSPPH